MEVMNMVEVVFSNGEVVKTLFETKNKLVPCTINVKLPVFNPKVTSRSITVYTALVVKKYKNNYLVAYKRSAPGYSFTAPLGSIVVLQHTTGSWKNVHHRYVEYFIVKDAGERKHIFRDLEERENVEGTVKNLVPVDLSGFNRAEIEAEVYNTYNALLSQFDPVDVLYYIWIKTRQHEDTVSDKAEKIRRLKEMIEQKERELEELRRELQRLLGEVSQ